MKITKTRCEQDEPNNELKNITGECVLLFFCHRWFQASKLKFISSKNKSLPIPVQVISWLYLVVWCNKVTKLITRFQIQFFQPFLRFF